MLKFSFSYVDSYKQIIFIIIYPFYQVLSILYIKFIAFKTTLICLTTLTYLK